MKITLKSKKAMALSIAGTVLVSTAMLSFAGPSGDQNGRYRALEKMLDSVELTEQQEVETQRILDALPAKSDKRGGMMKKLLVLNPDDPDFIAQADETARQAGEQVVERLNIVAKARKDLYALLTPEQKQVIDKRIQRKLKRMQKHEQN
jgi:Spy/CpxP family protein refolding chaperone